ncbi:sensor histidine kinase [Agaribacter flavus]|uniref:histidine kinase n=1 Tax=Agaribacter flavus TaxID=1902781 RepID=A0ABV7FN23_9ALTE
MNKKPKQKSFFQFFNRVFLSLSGVILGVTLLSGFIFSRLYLSVEKTVEYTVPSVNRVASIGANTVLLSTLIPRISSVTEIDKLDILKQQINQSLQQIDENFSDIDTPDEQQNSISTLVANLKQSIDDYINLKTASLQQTVKLVPLNTRLLDALSIAIQEMRLLAVDVELVLFKTNKENELKQNLTRMGFINDIISDLELLSTIVLNTNNEDKPLVLEQVQEEFNTIFRNITFSLSNIDIDTPDTLHLAIRDVYSLALSNGNYFERIIKQSETNIKVVAGAESIERTINEVSAELTPILSARAEQDSVALSSLLSFTHLYFAIVIMITVVTLLFVAYINRVVIPRRIIQPLQDMAQDIVKLSRDEVKTLQFSHDSTELQEIKQALLIFQQNAEQLRHREDELLNANSQLTQLNKNLNMFIRVSSHDLRTPLRGIEVLAHMIEEDLDNNEIASAKRHNARVKTRVKRIDQLVASLSEYVRAERPETNIVEVEFKALVDECIDLLNVPTSFEFTIDTQVAKIRINQIAFTTVIRNLIDNAIKHHDCDQGAIEITLSESQSHYEISVVDDGPGVPARFQERIFKPFETLQPKDKVEGSGMGLSIIKKLIEHHKGDIHLQSPIDDERGARFTFTWEKML